VRGRSPSACFAGRFRRAQEVVDGRRRRSRTLSAEPRHRIDRPPVLHIVGMRCSPRRLGVAGVPRAASSGRQGMHHDVRRVCVCDAVIRRVSTYVAGLTEYRWRRNTVVIQRVVGRRRRRRRRCGRIKRLLVDGLRLLTTSPPCEQKDQAGEQ